MYVNPYLLVIFIHLRTRKASVYCDCIYSAGLNECGIKQQQNEDKLVPILLSSVLWSSPAVTSKILLLHRVAVYSARWREVI